MKKNFSFNLLPANRDLQKRWFVQVKVFNAVTAEVRISSVSTPRPEKN